MSPSFGLTSERKHFAKSMTGKQKHSGPFKMAGRLESLVEAAVETPLRPGVFMIDPGALRTLLLELVRAQQQTGEGPTSTLRVRTSIISRRRWSKPPVPRSRSSARNMEIRQFFCCFAFFASSARMNRL